MTDEYLEDFKFTGKFPVYEAVYIEILEKVYRRMGNFLCVTILTDFYIYVSFFLHFT
jgi:hypothetical protein